MKIFSTNLFLFTLLVFISRHGHAQEYSTVEFPFSYFEGVSEPAAGWYLPGFDDAGWESDTGIIGYGYFDGENPMEDVQVGTSVNTLYIRGHFQVDNKADFEEVNFFADYDDGFIAYLNGHEIVRVNVDPELPYPAYNDLAIRSHEMQIYGWDNEPVLGYYLDSLQLDSILVEGDNVIAVQVLNDSINGSDLQFIGMLMNVTDFPFNMYDLPSRYKRYYPVDSTSMPIVLIETDEFGIPYHHIRRDVIMGIIDNGAGKYNKPTDSCNSFYGYASMWVKGESSKDFQKRSYRIELIDSLGADSSVSLMGMPADEDWVLAGPFQDKALFRNPMVFDLGRKLNGSYQPRSRFVEVYFNGEYIGLYSLMETIKRGNDRVDIARLRAEEISGNDLTGGYILRFDKPNGSLQIDYPKADVISPEQEEYIMGYYQEYSTVLTTSYFMDPDSGYVKYINDTSLVDYLIVNEITKNADSYLNSTYFYKDRNDRDPRFHFGPLWDMDLAFGNSRFQNGDRYDEWQFDNQYNSNNRLKVRKLFQDPALVDLFQERWWAARETKFSTDSLVAYIDSVVAFLGDASTRNWYVWPMIDENIFNCNYLSQNYEEEIINIKNWLIARLDWMDENIDDIFYEVVIPTEVPYVTEYMQFSYEVYPNPFSEKLILEINSTEVSEVQLQVFDLVGTLKYAADYAVQPGATTVEIDTYEMGNIPSGIYLMKLAVNGNLFATQRLTKQ
ncbi:MAG: CotH kinase family protein [Bacteroidales bacterium]|nr:CotH kinase family protein [Bacteroidales bacterium]